MYIPSRFRQDDIEALLTLVRSHPFATLVTQSPAGPDAMHLPMLLEQQPDKLLLKGHIAKANPLWKTAGESAQVLGIFHGPNCYISPNHYPSKAMHGKAVPTWNYVAVHVKGSLTFKHDKSWLLKLVDGLTQEHESKEAKPWSVNDAPDSYIDKLLDAIVGVEIEVEQIEGQWKLSQNQPPENIAGVIEGLKKSGDNRAKQVAEWVSKSHSKH